MKIRTKKGKSYSLEFIKNVFSDTLCAIIEKNKGRIINGAEKTIYQRIQGLEKWCEHLVKDDSAVASYLKTTDGKDNPIGGDWLSYKIQLSNYLKKEFPSVGSRQKHISAINWWFGFLADFGFAPDSIKLPHPDKDSKENIVIRANAKKKVVLDTTSSADIPEQYQDYISEFIDSVAPDDPDRDIKISLYINATQELAHLGNDHSDAPFHKLMEEALLHRLVRIRNIAEATFRKAKKRRLRFINEARKGEKHFDLLQKWLSWQKGTSGGNTNPHTPELGNLTKRELVRGLLYCVISEKSKFHGVGFRYSSMLTHQYNRLRKYLQKRDITITAEQVIEMVGASKELLVSAQLILVDELTANASSVRNLPRDSTLKVNDHAIATIFDKPRARYRKYYLVEALLTEKDGWHSAYEVINELLEATNSYVGHTIPRDKGNLFLYNYQNSTRLNKESDTSNDKHVISTPSDEWFNVHTQALLSPIASGLTAKSIRESRILLEGLQKGLKSAQSKGRHVTSLVTNKHYLDKIAYTKKLENEIRKFMEWLEALVVIDIENYAAKVGYDEKAFGELQQKIKDDGFGGIVCNDPNAGVQEGTVKGDGCGMFLKCLTCKERSSVFFVNQQNVTQMVLWKRALASHVKGLSEEQASTFYMWCQFIDTIYRELESDPAHEAILLQSENIADQYESENGNPYQDVLKEMQDA